jgi:hypothetical protein
LADARMGDRGGLAAPRFREGPAFSRAMEVGYPPRRDSTRPSACRPPIARCRLRYSTPGT